MNNEQESTASIEEKLSIVADLAESINYAAWQNSVPLIRSLRIDNSTSESQSDLRLEFSTTPTFAHKKKWIIQKINADGSITIDDREVRIDPDYLSGLDEAERGIVELRLYNGDQLLIEASHDVRVLARDEWGGMQSMGELLAAFVMPNDPALAKVLKLADSLLAKHGHPSGLDGYQSGDPRRAYMLTAAIWSSVASLSLTYANPPSSFEKVGQKTRRVTQVLQGGLATCLDSTLLFAAAIEAVGLNSIIVMKRGHCFVGVWLVERTLNQLIETDCSEIRKAIAAQELIVFETTLVTYKPAGKFEDAIKTAATAIHNSEESDFVAAIDIARARMAQIRPLASHESRTHESRTTEETNSSEASGPLPLPVAPTFGLTAGEGGEEKPTTQDSRIDRWQRKLLDLSLRNRLLNFKLNKQSIPVLCPNISKLEDRLADGKRLRMISLSEHNSIGDRDAEIHQKKTNQDLDIEFAKQALDNDEITCPLTDKDLSSRLTTLYRKVRNDLAEGGSNTLYLAVGFLKWKQKPSDSKSNKAPLLLVPVKLLRKSALSPYHLVHYEDDVRFNATLIQLLKKDFDCDLSRLETDLPTDESGVDVPLVLEKMRQAVRDIPGFEVVDESAISTFSFSKYLMWKDLADRAGQLEKNRVVRHLIQEPDKPFSSGVAGDVPQPWQMDVRYTPDQIVHPLPADSSQLAAVMAASEGQDFVLVGPPGTGKSQTIANIISQCLATKKTVLFVAEKTAALDVVYRRLREHGLGDCCIELHSNKAERRKFLDQLNSSWQNNRRPSKNDWITVSGRLRIHRDELNTYVATLHTPAANGWTAYKAMGVCVKDGGEETPSLDWPASARHNKVAYQAFKEAIEDLVLTFREIPVDVSLSRVEATEWSMGWETKLLECCRGFKDASKSFSSVLEKFSRLLGLPSLIDVSSAQLTPLYRLARELTQPELPPIELVSHEHLDELRATLDDRDDLLQKKHQSNEMLKGALDGFAEALGLSLPGGVSKEIKRPLYHLANELIRPELPPPGLVFHKHFDKLTKALDDRPSLLQIRNQCQEGLEARSFNQALIDRIQVSDLEHSWSKASASFWPLSAWRKNKTKKRLKTYMTADGVPDPEVDLPLLREYENSCERLVENLASLDLPSHLQAMVEQEAGSLNSRLHAAIPLREAMNEAGLTPNVVGEASLGTLDFLVDAAHRLYPPGRELEKLRLRLQSNMESLGLSPHLQVAIEQDSGSLDSQIQAAQKLRETTFALGFAGDLGSQTLQSILAASEQPRRELASECCRSAKIFQRAWLEYTDLAKATPVAQESASIIAEAAAQAERVLSGRTVLKQWTAWKAVRGKAVQLGLSAFVDAIQTGELATGEAADQFELAYARWWLPNAIDGSDALRTFQRFKHEDTIEDFKEFDDLARASAPLRAIQAITHDLPDTDKVPRKSELGLLRHQIGLKRPSKSIREVIAGMPETFSKLAPCMLMSPISIAQYLPADQSLFDVVIFDEASQITTWDAIGAIARGKQTIIVGDPKQLPPTNFFGRNDDDEDNEDLDDHEKDLESILDEAQVSGLPTLQLNWHYRSRHESLIAFSNRNYYGNNLVTFPSADSAGRGVSLRYVPEALYDRGNSRTNRKEAEAIVQDAVARMTKCLEAPEEERLTYGVITFNSQQQTLIQDLFDQALRDNPEIEWFFSDDRIEPTAVKNLENVQGDERDVMFFSITFGYDADGKFPVSFGAINRDGGERRLNVAITRARQELVVFTSFKADQLQAERSRKRGVHDLKSFIEYAEKGPAALAAESEGSADSFDSPFEEAIAEALIAKGWQAVPQIGVSCFRVDLGIVHPDKPGSYLAGVECDGATYHRSAVARDRDKTRQQVLENLGWNIIRVWSPDWWYDADSAIQRVDETLTELLENDRLVEGQK